MAKLLPLAESADSPKFLIRNFQSGDSKDITIHVAIVQFNRNGNPKFQSTCDTSP